MSVQKIISAKGSDVATIKPSATAADAAILLKENGVGALVVSKDGKQVDGIVSERDIVRALGEPDGGGTFLDRPVSEIMTADVQTCAPEDSIGTCMSMMTEKRIRHLPVMRNDAMIGIVSIGDVVKNRLEELEVEAGFLRELIAS